MSRLDDLPPDQRATLSLLLRSGKSYADVASLLEIPERSVRDRAHAALAVLAPAQARSLDAGQREALGDYLLGQRAGVGERLATRTLLERSPAARAWAGALAEELQPLSSEPLPEIPSATEEPAAASAEPAPRAAGERTAHPRAALPSSRRAGAALLGVIAIVVIVVVVLILSGGGSSKHNAAAEAAKSSTAAGETGATGTQTAKAKEDKRITLTSPDPTSKATGVAEVLSEGSQYAFYLAAAHLPPTKGFFYAVWLYNSPTSFQALSRAPNVGSDGNVQGGALLPKDAGNYHTMLLTRETSSKPSSPGPVVLRGPFALH